MLRLPNVGDIITASVTSKEDHGYIMDIGSNTVRGFVPSKTMTKFKEVTVGQVRIIQHSDWFMIHNTVI